MNYYQAYRRPNDTAPALVRQGFYWRLLILGPVGFLFRRSWIAFGLTASLNMLILRLGGPDGGLLTIIVNLGLALFGAEIFGWEARLNGGIPEGIWLGRTEEDARLRFGDKMQVSS